MNRYKALRDSPEWDAKAGDEFEAELSAEDENEYVGAGRIAICEREYEVVGTSLVFENEPGSKFMAAIPKGQEELLLGYHLERVKPKPKAKADKGA